jgi:hypothetical protein
VSGGVWRAALPRLRSRRPGLAGGLRWRDFSPALSGWILAALVAGSTVAYALAAGGVRNIWILPDELVYGSLARSFATTGHFALRGVVTFAYPVGYPFLIAPAFVGRDPVAAYEAAKCLNAALMSLASVPVFLLGRRLLPNWLALVAAALSLLVPSLAYTGVLMAENAAFPLFLLALLAIVRALEEPSVQRQIVALAAIVPVAAVRAEGVMLAPILVGSILIFSLSTARWGHRSFLRDLPGELARFSATWLVIPLSLVALVVGEAGLGRSPTALLGRYAGSARAYPLVPTLRWSMYQFADLELYLAVLPFVPASIAVLALLRRRNIARAQRAVAATALSATVFMVLTAGAASSGSQGGPAFNYPNLPPNLHDRYCFYVAPLYLVLFLFWVHRRRDFSTRALLPLLVAASALPLVLPYATVDPNAQFDALALLPWNNSLIAARNVHYAMAVVAAILCVSLIPRRSSIALMQVGLVAVLLWFVGLVARDQIAAASLLVPSSRLNDLSWIDASVPPEASVAVVWAPERGWSFHTIIRREQALWRAEFFNPSVRRFFYVGAPMFYDLPSTRVRLRDGRLIARPGTTIPRYLLVASPVRIDGRAIARDRRAGLVLYRLT